MADPHSYQPKGGGLEEVFLLELLSDGRILDLIAGKEAQTVFQILYLQSLCEAGFASLCQNHTDGLMENSRNVLDLALIDIDRQDELAYMRKTGRASCSRKMRMYAKKMEQPPCLRPRQACLPDKTA